MNEFHYCLEMVLGKRLPRFTLVSMAHEGRDRSDEIGQMFQLLSFSYLSFLTSRDYAIPGATDVLFLRYRKGQWLSPTGQVTCKKRK